MKRTDADQHSSNLFQDRNLPTTAGTLIESTWLNNVQEEIANVIEQRRRGTILSGANDEQLVETLDAYGLQAILGTGDGSSFYETGLGLTDGGGLNANLANGAAYIRGKRFEINAVSYQIGLVASRDNYVAFNSRGAIELNDVAISAGAPTPSAGFQNIAFVRSTGVGFDFATELIPRVTQMALDLDVASLWRFMRRIRLVTPAANYEGIELVTHFGAESGQFDDEIVRHYEVRGTTTTNGDEDIIITPSLSAGKQYDVTVRVLGVRNDGASRNVSWDARRIFERTGAGNLTSVYGHSNPAITINNTPEVSSLALVAVSQAVVLRVTGTSVNTYNWRIKVEVAPLEFDN